MRYEQNQRSMPNSQSSQMANSVATFSAPEMAPRPVSHAHQVITQRQITLYKRMLLVFALIHFVYLLFLQTRADVLDNSTLRVISDLLVLFGGVVCTATCGYAFWKLRTITSSDMDILAKRAGIALLCLALSAGAYSIGQGIWTWYEATTPLANFPFPASYDPFYLAVYPFSLVGVTLLLPRSGTIAGQSRLVLDSATAVASILAISWYFLLGPTLSNLSGEPLAKIVALSYPVGDIALLIIAAVLLFGTAGSTRFNTTLTLLSIGVTLLALTDALYAYFLLKGVYHTGFIQDIGWPLSWLFIGWSALTYLNSLAQGADRRVENEAAPTRLNKTATAVRAVAPMSLALLTCAVLLIEVAFNQNVPLVQIVLVCVGLFIFPIIRQGLTLVDNMILNERLRVSLNQSQQAFRDSQKELLSTTSRVAEYEELRLSIEEIQSIHAALARGNMSVRASVQGPLAPVAQSLNLLIERMHRWSQLSQQVQVMENEGRTLTHQLELLSDGKLPARQTQTPSPLASGAALLALTRLAGRLQAHQRRQRETLERVGSRNATVVEGLNRTRQALHEQMPTQQVEMMLTQLERGLTGNQEQLLDLHKQAQIFEDQERKALDAHTLPSGL